MQEQGVPPWERAALPLVYEVSAAGEAWIAIGDLWCSEQYSGGAHAAGWRLIVERDCD
jgi:tRNA(Ile)-lysidine synthase|tara:strand:- start:1165 stop:1338 length:174 start_codon:yes stop_codon:yes gene_type:complete